MVYDPVGRLNTSIAEVFALGVTVVLWAVIAPETPEAGRRRFLRVARRAIHRLIGPRRQLGIAAFETSIAEALDQLQSRLRPDRSADIADLAAGSRLLSARQALLGSGWNDGAAPQTVAVSSYNSNRYLAYLLECGRTEPSHEPDQQELRDAA